MPAWNFVRVSVYEDSVTLMRLSRDMEAVPGVKRAAAMMATPANRDLLRDAELLTAVGEQAASSDVVIAVIADDERAALAARDAADAALAARRATTAASDARGHPRTLASALKALPDANLAIVSVPGAYAGAEARRCLDAGLHVMLFSDNVPVEAEIALKQRAGERHLFMMGPDCGTAIIDGVPLGFANAVPRGRIGLAAASGTGLQEVSCLIAAAGEGISQAIGLGGRDLSDEVGGLMLERALDALVADAATDVIGVLGKRPGRTVATRLAARVATLGKPCVVHFAGQPGAPGFRWTAMTLEDCAAAAVALARGAVPLSMEFGAPAGEIDRLVAAATARMAQGQRFVRGIYAGGTLAWEAIGILGSRLRGVAENVLGDGKEHRVTDLGEDRFTVGRPHPMIDGTLRRDWIDREGRDPVTAVLLLDVVLGYGAHPDPAAEILPAIDRAIAEARRRGRDLAVVASVCGTERDPQRRSAQVAALHAGGVTVMPSNAQASRLAALIAERCAS